ncbi:glycosyltransferase family 2 protein [Asticcacaulis solisilvae]|uniref:glycosyltransferase family 2 protein n=1 Tax=Asticcacaulis solisilvae TaxID=1217274 RepID=UPI003FD7197E
MDSSKPPASISCVVCAYNEADSLSDILRAVGGHPLFREVIVVDDGSTDGTAAVARSFPDVRVISYARNRGKTHALSLGIEAASGDHIMLIDADLKGLKASNIFALAEPVLDGLSGVSISLRANSLALYRALGLDFVSGERVLPAALVKPHVAHMRRLPRWGAEAFMNGLITGAGLPIAVVEWPDVFNIRKAQKIGAWRGTLAELSMTADVFRVLTPVTVVQQTLAMLNLVSWRTAPRRRSRPAPVALTQLRSLLFGES